MKYFYTILFILTSFYSAICQPPKAPEGYKWAKNKDFSDEFNKKKLDKKKWHARSPFWVNGRAPATFRANTVSVKDGKLQIKNRLLNEPNDPKYYIAGGAVASVSTNAFYGYYETRMLASSISMSSTFWLKNKPDPSNCEKRQEELDIAEIVGQRKTGADFVNKLHVNTHIFKIDCDGNRETKSKGNIADIIPAANEAYHVYGAWWVDPNTINFYLDGKFLFTVNPSTHFGKNPFNRPMFMHLVTETYNWEVPPSAEELADDSKNTTYYDWVRSYKLVKK